MSQGALGIGHGRCAVLSTMERSKASLMAQPLTPEHPTVTRGTLCHQSGETGVKPQSTADGVAVTVDARREDSKASPEAGRAANN